MNDRSPPPPADRADPAADKTDFTAMCSRCEISEWHPEARSCQLPQCPLRKAA